VKPALASVTTAAARVVCTAWSFSVTLNLGLGLSVAGLVSSVPTAACTFLLMFSLLTLGRKRILRPPVPAPLVSTSFCLSMFCSSFSTREPRFRDGVLISRKRFLCVSLGSTFLGFSSWTLASSSATVSSAVSGLASSCCCSFLRLKILEMGCTRRATEVDTEVDTEADLDTDTENPSRSSSSSLSAAAAGLAEVVRGRKSLLRGLAVEDGSLASSAASAASSAAASDGFRVSSRLRELKKLLSLSRLLSSLMGLVMPSPTAEGRSAISFSATS